MVLNDETYDVANQNKSFCCVKTKALVPRMYAFSVAELKSAGFIIAPGRACSYSARQAKVIAREI